MDKIKIRFKKLSQAARMPYYASDFAAGADLFAATETSVDIPSGATVAVGTGIAVEIPAGYVGLVFARSGLARKQGLAPANKVGVIDSDYRGEIIVALHNHSTETQTISAGERIAQIVFIPYLAAEFEESDTLGDTARGEGGFGSTGRK